MIAGAVKNGILRGPTARLQDDSIQNRTRPSSMLHKPKKRSCPSCRSSSRANVRFHAPGDTNGNKPSSTSTRASAVQSASQSKAGYFFEGAAAAAPPRKALKKSEPEGSTMKTSPFLLKLCL